MKKRKRKKGKKNTRGDGEISGGLPGSQRSLQGCGAEVITLAAGPRQRVAEPLSLGGGRQGYFSAVYSSAISVTSAERKMRN